MSDNATTNLNEARAGMVTLIRQLDVQLKGENEIAAMNTIMKLIDNPLVINTLADLIGDDLYANVDAITNPPSNLSPDDLSARRTRSEALMRHIFAAAGITEESAPEAASRGLWKTMTESCFRTLAVTETISDGDTKFRREVRFDMRQGGVSVDPEAQILACLGQTSPRQFKFNAYTNPSHAQALMELRSSGRCSVGSAVFEISGCPSLAIEERPDVSQLRGSGR
jgi:hypothetical protein